MNQIEKILSKLQPRMRDRVRDAYVAILQNKLKHFDVKPLKGKKNWFRCRVGDIRIIFARISSGENVILEVRYRDQAYRNI